ncbi:MAG: flagellar biosynthetic protein FliR [Phycisphaerales bacterium]
MSGEALVPLGLAACRVAGVAAFAPAFASTALSARMRAAIAMLPVAAFRAAGSLAGVQMGLGFGAAVSEGASDAMDGDDAVGQVLGLAGAAMFVWAGGLDAVALASVRSFDYVGLGLWRPGEGTLAVATGAACAACELSLRVAMPVTVVLVVDSLVSGLVARSVPGISPIAFGFPVRAAVGLFALATGAWAMQSSMDGAVAGMLDAMHSVAGGAR